MPRGGKRPNAGRKPRVSAPGAAGFDSTAPKTVTHLNRGGRKPGVPNKATTEAKEFAAAILGDPRYVKKLRARAFAGKLHPSVETMLWYYRSGKPKERVEHSGRVSLIDLLVGPAESAEAPV